MSGRYYVDDDTAREIEQLVRLVDEKMRKKTAVLHHRAVIPADGAKKRDMAVEN